MRSRNRFLASFAALAMVACGGSDGGDGGSGLGGAPNSFARGTVEKVGGGGGIVVNGVTWKTAGGSLNHDGVNEPLETETEIESHLRRGMVVSVQGRIDDSNPTTGQATAIRFGEDFQGPVTAVGASSFTVLGLNVVADAQTVIVNSAGAPQPFSAIAVGTRVEVSGSPDAGGSFRASHVKIEDGAETEVEAKGFVVASTVGDAFGLALTQGGAPFVNVLAGAFAAPTVGSFVEVKGTTSATTPPTIAQTRAPQLEDDFNAAGLKAEVEGIITGGTSFDAFQIASREVRTTATTQFIGGVREDFRHGIKVEAEGQVDAGGVLNATKVKFKGGARIAGSLQGVDAGESAAGEFTLLGLAVVVDAATDKELDGAAGFALSQFAEVRGYRRADGKIQAQEIRLETSPGGGDRAFVQGVVTAKTPTSSLTIFDIGLDTATAQFRNAADAPMAAAAFFDAIVTGQTVVKARWSSATPAITDAIAEAEIEGEDD